jgi:hypothetical protein
MSGILRILAAGLICALGMMTSNAMAGVSLVHRYSFNDGTANDSVGRANGKLVGGVTIADGSAQFSGAPGQRIELLANGAGGININSFKAVTFEAWYTADKAQKWQRLFDFGSSKDLEAADSTGGYCVNYIVTAPYSKAGNSVATLSNVDPSWTKEVAAKANAAPLNQQVHMAVVVDGSTITLFINGAQASQAPLDDRTLAKLSNQYALLGHSLYGANPSLAGSINEFRIYSGAATAVEIAASFRAGANRPVIGVGTRK